MKSGFSSAPVARAAVLCSLLLGTTACRKEIVVPPSEAPPVTKHVPTLTTNTLSSLPGAIYRSAAESPIRWQPWTHESVENARQANRLVLAIVAVPQQPDFKPVLNALEEDPEIVAAINDNYVPILIDGDASREIGLLTYDLCSEIQRNLQLPLFIWMSPDGNPVAWIPVSKTGPETVASLFRQSHEMVSRMWRDDFQYVVKNSAKDSASRKDRIAARKNANVMSKAPGEDVIRSLRQITSLYDSFTRTFDEAGGLFPAGAIDFMSTAAVHPGIPAETQDRCRETVGELLKDLLPSAMIDPLDGGMFSARRKNSWALPAFSRDCISQGRAAVSLLNAYRATGDQRALETALGIIHFAEKAYTTTEGVFAVGLESEKDPAAFLWNIEDIKKILSPEDAAWWITATGMQDTGNLPMEADPRRDFFRLNSLGLGKSVTQIAADRSEPLETFAPRFDQVRQTLLKARNNRLGPEFEDDSSHAGATFRMVSAYAAAFGATGDEQYRQKAVDLLEKARSLFSDGPKLVLFSKPAPPTISAGRAFLYALALQASLDVAAVTSDAKWLTWAEDLATTAAELFTTAEFLRECPIEAQIMDLPITDVMMIFDDSTAGLISFAECRLSVAERPLVSTFSDLATPLPTFAARRPIFHTDLLQATLARENKVILIHGTGLSGELKLASERLPARMIQRRPAKPADDVPAGSIKVILPNREPVLASSPEALAQAFLR
ncbi:MAG: DUF255 domain-containing protein [Luteolibacter sp.]